MPNHVHGIIEIKPNVNPVGAKNFSPKNMNDMVNNFSPEIVNDNKGAKYFSPLPPRRPNGTSRTIGSIVRGFKIGVTIRAKDFLPLRAKSVWQRNYYEHIIRDHHSLCQIANYIEHNPENWDNDILK